jgi:hypothetical protein
MEVSMFFTEKPCCDEGSALARVEFEDWLDTNSGWEPKRAIAVTVTSDTQAKGFIVSKINR